MNSAVFSQYFKLATIAFVYTWQRFIWTRVFQVLGSFAFMEAESTIVVTRYDWAIFVLGAANESNLVKFVGMEAYKNLISPVGSS